VTCFESSHKLSSAVNIDSTGAQIGNNDCSDDIKNVNLSKVHNLSGPIAVAGAEPGDCLVVDILDVTPFEEMPWGYTAYLSLKMEEVYLVNSFLE